MMSYHAYLRRIKWIERASAKRYLPNPIRDSEELERFFANLEFYAKHVDRLENIARRRFDESEHRRRVAGMPAR